MSDLTTSHTPKIPTGFRIPARGCRRLPRDSLEYRTTILKGLRNRCLRASVPKVFFIIINPVTIQKLAVFLLEVLVPMVLRLRGNIGFNFADPGCRNRKNTITGLPLKDLPFRSSVTEPMTANPFRFLYEIRDGNRPRKPGQQMDVISHSSDLDRRAVQLVCDNSEIPVQFRLKTRIFEKRKSVFCRKNGVEVNLIKRLRHFPGYPSEGGRLKDEQKFRNPFRIELGNSTFPGVARGNPGL